MAKLQDEVTALVFDTWGTVVDWRSSVLDELCALGRRKDLKIDWEVFLDEWRSAYEPAMQKVNSGELPWTKMDVFYRQALVQLLSKHNITGLGEDDIEYLNRAWTRTRPWSDSVAGLTLLKRRYILSPCRMRVLRGSLLSPDLLVFRLTASSARKMHAATSPAQKFT
jgi:2-haloacid dehalogenase